MRVKRCLYGLIGWAAGVLLILWRLTCRRRNIDDVRGPLHQSKRGFIIAILHAHQVGCVISSDEPGMMAMVSASTDGDLLVPALKLRRVNPVRGSTRRNGREKGGRRALQELRRGASQGKAVLLAVDGPRGPRNTVHRGVAELALNTGLPIACTMARASRRWILDKTWDRFQIPLPFCRVDQIWAPLIEPQGHSIDSLRQEVAQVLKQLEITHDPQEAQRCGVDLSLSDVDHCAP